MIQRVERILLILIAFKIVGKVEMTSSPNIDRNMGDDCVGPDNEAGICTIVTNCIFLLEANVKVKRKFINLSNMCAFAGTTVKDFVVCCPYLPVKNLALEACTNFGKKPDVEAERAELPYFAIFDQSEKTNYNLFAVEF